MSFFHSRRSIELETRGGKPERLFRASICAYCALARPGRAEAAQLDDLALPLLPSVSEDGLRFAAAALSETRRAPAELVRRLADLPVAISAPLLIRSKALRDIDLVTLIGRHGLPHARAIAARRDLDPAIAALVRTLGVTNPGQEPAAIVPASSAESPAETARARLRAIMRPAEQDDARPEKAPADPAPLFERMLAGLLADMRPLVEGLLAHRLDIGGQHAGALTQKVFADLPHALRRLGLSLEQAFMIAFCMDPAAFRATGDVRRFADAYRSGETRESARLTG